MKVNGKEKELIAALISKRTDVCLIVQIGVPLKFSISLNISKKISSPSYIRTFIRVDNFRITNL